MTDWILLQTDDAGIATLTLNRPEKLNSIRLEMIEPWCDALRTVATDPAIKVLILTGAGRAFCAGGDVGGVREREHQDILEQRGFLDQLHRIPLLFAELDKPVLAAINGPARGAGVDISLMCDIRVCGESASFAESYINVGLTPSDGGAWFLPRIIGTDRALEMIWTARAVSAQEALEIGLVTYLHPDAELMDRTRELALRIANQPQDAVRFSKRAVYHGRIQTLASHLDMIASYSTLLRHTEAHRERLASYMKGKDKNK